MTIDVLITTVRKRFKDLVAVPEELPSQYDNAPFDKPTDAMWVRCSVLPGEADQISLGPPGSKRYRTVGVMLIQIFIPAGKGDGDGYTLAGTIDDNFRSVKADGITWRKPSTTNLGRQGKWWRINVSCPFQADDLNT